MEIKSSRAVVVASLGVGFALLAAGCGSEASGSRSTLATIQSSSYVTIEPATTTTTLAVPDSIEPGTSPDAQTYTVVAGDSVSKIASMFGISAEVLANFNSWPEGVQHPIFPGDVINIPPGASIPGASPGATPDSGGTDDGDVDPETGEGCTHTIAAGENPTRVANKYDLTFDQLQAANPFMDFSTTFVVGDTLTIPPEGNCG